MKKVKQLPGCIIFGIIALFVLNAGACFGETPLVSDGAPGIAQGDYPFKPGERLVFEIKWLFIPAGTATLEVLPMDERDGKPVWHFALTANTNKFADAFYKVRDKIDSFTDSNMSHTVFYKKKQREGDTKRDVEVYLDWENDKATYVQDGDRSKPIDIAPGSFDPLSVFYYFRTQPLDGDQEVRTSVTDGKKCVVGKAIVKKKTTVKVPAGKYETFLVEPELKHIGGVFKKSKNAKLKLWFSTGPDRLIVRIKSKVVVGSFTAELISVEQVEPMQNSTVASTRK